MSEYEWIWNFKNDICFNKTADAADGTQQENDSYLEDIQNRVFYFAVFEQTEFVRTLWIKTNFNSLHFQETW